MNSALHFRTTVKQQLLKAMTEGTLGPGDFLSLAQLARDLNVSVTPIREALTQLEQAQIVQSVPNRGFQIPELETSEIPQLYPIVAALECLAMEQTQYGTVLIYKLREKQRLFSTAKTALERIQADMSFHETLTQYCENDTVLHILSDLKVRIFFYELDFMQEYGFDTSSEAQHDQIISHLERHEINKAIALLKTNWLQILNNTL
ncbi:GntR family transcriptional regulator [Altibacter sp. HG106]|uniref:GntR family transcriptional regulator n=1 Tax=Altibacter sp. HG106 TaxID=3023937 RepID=UPI00234FFB9C|nr:GntR family transcriptional regulator [Altibacter sp. HG106]MDC7993548.1 GntR family transcriptional regulator [Altibacter sp. HG106]